MSGTNQTTAPSTSWASGVQCYNVTTVRYAINTKDTAANCTDGICATGANIGIIAPHTGGSNVAMGDGSVQFFGENTELLLLFRLCARNDGGVVSIP
jgi:prepilin-type processing-associated H-X9-DG protein